MIKVPPLPNGAGEARISHWYKDSESRELVARDELLVELSVRGEIIPLKASQAGILERIFFRAGENVSVGAVIAHLRGGLPDLVWDEKEETLSWEIYSAGRDESKNYDLRQLIRAQEGKVGKGFGNTLALPQVENNNLEQGMDYNESYQNQFKSHPAFSNSQQMAGDFKDPRVRTIPSNEAARKAPENQKNFKPDLGPRLGPRAPTPTPMK